YPGALEEQQKLFNQIKTERPLFVVVAMNNLFFTEGSELFLLIMMSEHLVENYQLDALIHYGFDESTGKNKFFHVYGKNNIDALKGVDPSKVGMRVYKRNK
ncbi:MAG: hypothetical protein V3T30_00355, partial [Thermodesulfobacteriota bacterium]